MHLCPHQGEAGFGVEGLTLEGELFRCRRAVLNHSRAGWRDAASVVFVSRSTNLLMYWTNLDRFAYSDGTTVDYHPEFGFPVVIDADPGRDTIDGEIASSCMPLTRLLADA